MGQCLPKFCPRFEKKQKKNYDSWNDDIWRYTDQKLLKELEDPNDIASIEMSLKQYERKDVIQPKDVSPATIIITMEDETRKKSMDSDLDRLVSEDSSTHHLTENFGVFTSE